MITDVTRTEDINQELFTFVNVQLHFSYQFIFLRFVSYNLNMNGPSWLSEKKEPNLPCQL